MLTRRSRLLRGRRPCWGHGADDHPSRDQLSDRVHRPDRPAGFARCGVRHPHRPDQRAKPPHDARHHRQRARTAAAGRLRDSAREDCAAAGQLPARRRGRPNGQPDGRRARQRSRALSGAAARAVRLPERRRRPAAARPVAARVRRRARRSAQTRDLGRDPRRARAMKVKMILPALTEATSPFWRPIKYSLFPPLGLATLAAYLRDDDVGIQDEHVERLDLDDEPDLVVIQVYITSAYRAYRIADHYRAKGAHVALGGLHVTSLPDEAAAHADTIFLGPGEDTWPAFLGDFRRGCAGRVYQSRVRTLTGIPPIRRDLIKRRLYLVPNSIVVSRGCPHVCDFCYKVAFFKGGKQFYTQTVEAALGEIDRLPGRHLYFLDDHLFGSPPFAEALFEGMRGMNRLWQAAG